METMQSWFGLKEEHRDFMIDYDTDAKLFFGRTDLDAQLMAILHKSFRTGNPPKFVLYGDWGVGKTHTMLHIQYVIRSRSDFPAEVVFVELPDISSKSTFQVAHAALLDALGLERARNWVVKYHATHGTSSKELIQEATQSGDVASAFSNLLGAGDGSRISWDWLRGEQLTTSDARLVGLPPRLDQSNQLVKVLEMFGRLCRESEDKLLVLMIDEATKLSYVTASDAINHWTNAIKIIANLQTRDVGLIISGSWIETDDMALPLMDQQVMSRFGESNYIRLNNLDEKETVVFIKALLSEWVDDAKRKIVEKTYPAQAKGETITEHTFPFTAPALDLAAAYACRQGGYTTPREIQQTLDDLFNRAIDDNIHILAEDYLQSQVNG